MDKFYKTNLKLVAQKNKKNTPNFKQFKYLSLFLNSKEKIFLKLFILLILISGGYFVFRGYQNINSIPTSGGSYTEGVIGQIQYLNPILSSSNTVDSDISKLIYSSLFIHKNRILTPEIVDSYKISEDHKKYTFQIKDNIIWHDGEKLTSNDIIFTINSIQNPNYKSPLFMSFKDVKAEKINDYEFSLNLQEPYSPFINYLTFGILPKHIWQDVSYIQFPLSEYNLKPIGSGPYKFKTLSKSKEGLIKSYTLEDNNKYFKNKPFIKEITFKFFNDTQDAVDTIKEKQIDGISFVNHGELEGLKETSIKINKFNLPQYSGLFFNNSLNKSLQESYIRKSLILGTDKDSIIQNIFKGNAEKVESIFLKNTLGYDEDFKNYEFDPTRSVELLESNGWKRNDTTGTMQKDGKDLEFTITTVNNQDNILVINEIKKQWEKLGIKTNIQLVDKDSIKEDIIKSRNYEILLYGEILGEDSDPFPFWHSSQIKNPGLNLAMYSSKEIDQAIEKARKTTNTDEIKDLYKFIQDKIKEDIPAILLYNPTYIYITNENLNGISETNITKPSDRFNEVENWYIKTKKKVF